MEDRMVQVADRLSELLVVKDGGIVEFRQECYHVAGLARLREARDNMATDRRSAMDVVYEALDEIGSMGEDYNDDVIFESSGPDVYASDLLEWMAEDWHNKCWVDQAPEEDGGDVSDIVDLIMRGQSMMKEHGRRLVRNLVREIAEEDCDETE